MSIQGAYTVKKNTRQVRSPLREPLDIKVDLDLPEEVCFKLCNINLGGMGIAIPVAYDPTLSREENIERNSIRVAVEIDQEIHVSVPEGGVFKRPISVTAIVRYIAQAQKVNSIPCVCYLGLAYKNLPNKAFSTIESAIVRL